MTTIYMSEIRATPGKISSDSKNIAMSASSVSLTQYCRGRRKMQVKKKKNIYN